MTQDNSNDALVDCFNRLSKALDETSKVFNICSSLLTPPSKVPAPVPAPVVVPSGLPIRRVTLDELTFVRTVRLPNTSSNGATMEFADGPFALGRERATLLVANKDGKMVAEVTIPFDPAVPFATYVQGFADPSEGAIFRAWNYVDAQGVTQPLAGLTGMIVLDDGRIMGNALVYYDANAAQRVSHFIRPYDLKDVGHVTPLTNVGNPTMTGYVAGYMARIPDVWREVLKGTYVTGTFGNPIVSRESLGPTAFSFVPADGPMPATSLLYYPPDHPTMGVYGTGPADPVYNMAAKASGLALIEGTCSALFFGRSGIGEQVYGAGTSDKSLVGQIESGSDRWVYDPADSSKGTHAYPYRYQIWAYDMNDWAAVAAGNQKPWNVMPYGVWGFTLPKEDPAFTNLHVAYDAVSQLLYLFQLRADVDGYQSRPYVHIYKVNL